MRTTAPVMAHPGTGTTAQVFFLFEKRMLTVTLTLILLTLTLPNMENLNIKNDW